MSLVIFVPVAALCILGAMPMTSARERARRTTPQDLDIRSERFELANGFTVILAPDDTVNSAVIDVTFRAGTLFEAPGKSGVAHLTEHAIFSGTAPDTNYLTMLEQQGAREVSAYTSPETMYFRHVVAPAGIPLALWAMTQRVLRLPGLLTEEEVSRHRRIVEAERRQQVYDAAYGPSEIVLASRLYRGGHPLRGSILGVANELATVSVADVRAHVSRYFVGANGIVTITGRFDPSKIKGWLDRTLAHLPRGERATPTRGRALTAAHGAVKVKELLSRRPRVTLAWRLEGLTSAQAEALRLGAVSLSILFDGFTGTEVDAYFAAYGDESMFRLDLRLPFEKGIPVAQQEAEATLRFLTLTPMPEDTLIATLLAKDFQTLALLDSVEARAAYLTRAELELGDASKVGDVTSRHWRLDREALRGLARSALKSKPLIVHSVPVNPLKEQE